LNEINEVVDLGMKDISDEWASEAIETRKSGSTEKAERETGEGTGKGEDDKSISSSIKKIGIPSNLATLTDEEYLAVYHDYVTEGFTRDNYEVALVNYFSKLEREQLGLLTLLKDCEGINKDTADNFMFDSEQWDKELKEESSPYYDATVIAATTFLAMELGGFTAFNPSTDSLMASAMRQKLIKVTGVNDTVKEQIREILLESIAAGDDIDFISGEIQNVFSMAKKRAKLIAETEIGQVAGFAKFRGMEVESARKKWVDSNDGAVRAAHKKYGSLGIKKLDYDYSNGSNLKYPSDMDCSDAKEILNCRCGIRAVKAT
jgi:hypothetical protein